MDDKPKRRIIRIGALVGFTVIFVIVISLLEGASYIFSNFLSDYGIFYQPQSIDGYDEYVDSRDPQLGWGPPADDELDPSGSREIPSNTNYKKACLSIYGDSFTWGDEVSAGESWANQLSLFLDCRVSNFGVPGYGTDQALLRFSGNQADPAKNVLLVHLSENIMRNVNQYRHLLYPGARFQFKPRFIIERGKLQLIKTPLFRKSQLADIFNNPEKYLHHEFFIPNGESGNAIIEFPYSFGIIRALKHFHITANLRGIPWYSEFYHENHSSGALQVTLGIIKEFVAEAKRQDRNPMVMTMPTGLDLVYYKKHGRWPFEKLTENLQQAGIPSIPIGEEIMRVIEDEDPCQYFTNCSGHFNARGNHLVAATLSNLLVDLKSAAD